MSTLRVDNIQAGPDIASVPISEMRYRVIKTARQRYAGGAWDPNDTYNWLPGGFFDYTPASASSRIRFTLTISFAHLDGHAISHCICYANGVELGRHCISGQSPEYRHTYLWDFASWGTSSGRIGYQIRRYGGSNRPRYNSTTHWNGTGSAQNAQTDIVIEEYFSI